MTRMMNQAAIVVNAQASSTNSRRRSEGWQGEVAGQQSADRADLQDPRFQSMPDTARHRMADTHLRAASGRRARARRRQNAVNCRIPLMCVPVKTIVNQLTIARKTATAPGATLTARQSLSYPLEGDPRSTPPTGIRCGIARINRNATVSRFRLVRLGSTLTVTG